MLKIFLFFYLLLINVFALNLGVLQSSKDDYISNNIANDISMLLKKYDIDIKVNNKNNSYDIINNLLKNKKGNFFAIVKKDTISKVNINKNIYYEIPAILSLGSEEIHIFKSESKEIDFYTQKSFNVYCGKKNSDSCISAKYIENAYDFNFTYIDNSKDIFTDLKNNKFDLFIDIANSPSKKYKDLTDVDLVDLPTNFKMEDMYSHSKIPKESYGFMSEDLHAFISHRVLITNLKDKKYNKIIKNIIKIILYNQKFLILNKGKYWKNIDFYYFGYKKFSKIAKKTILDLEDDIKQRNALIF